MKENTNLINYYIVCVQCCVQSVPSSSLLRSALCLSKGLSGCLTGAVADCDGYEKVQVIVIDFSIDLHE